MPVGDARDERVCRVAVMAYAVERDDHQLMPSLHAHQHAGVCEGHPGLRCSPIGLICGVHRLPGQPEYRGMCDSGAAQHVSGQVRLAAQQEMQDGGVQPLLGMVCLLRPTDPGPHSEQINGGPRDQADAGCG